VIVGETNANEVVITKGLSIDERIYLSTPKGFEEDEIKLLPELNGKRQKKDEKGKEKVASPAGPVAKAVQKSSTSK